MTPAEDPAARDGLRRLDGYLYLQNELAAARREAESVCDGLRWLTTTEREELLERYTAARTELTERMLRRIAARCTELRGEYEARYRQLRVRVVATAVSVSAGACAVLEMVRM